MSTEYRRGIPEIRDGVFHSDFESPGVPLGELRSGPGFWMPPTWVDLRPIRPDGLPVTRDMTVDPVTGVVRRWSCG